MTNVRTRNPAAGTARIRARAVDTPSKRYIPTDSARYGTTEVASSSRLRPTRGAAYGASASFQNGPADGGDIGNSWSSGERCWRNAPADRRMAAADTSAAGIEDWSPRIDAPLPARCEHETTVSV